MIYMCTRLIVNVTQVYTPLYVLEVIDLDRVSSCKHVCLRFYAFLFLLSPALPRLPSLCLSVDLWPVLLSNTLINT